MCIGSRNATSVVISGYAGAGSSVYWGLRKNYVPYQYRVGGVGSGGDEWTARSRTYSRTLTTASNFSKGLPGVWYLTYGGSGAGYATVPATYSPSVTVTISPKPTGVATIRITSPVSNDIFDVANGVYDTISWTVAGLTQGVRATYLAYQVTNNISPWVPIAEDYIFNINGTYDWRLPSSIKSTNARLMVMVEDVYGKFSTNYSGGFSLNTQGAYASLKSWVGAELPVSATRDRHVALGSEGTNLYFTMGNTLNAGFYRLPKGSSSASDWSSLSALPIPGTVNNDSGVGDMAYYNGYLWTLARSNDPAGARCVYRYSIGANTWGKGGAMAGDGPNTACAPVSDTRIYGGWMGWYRVKNITDWLAGATSDIGDLNGSAAHPWDSCMTTTDVYFIKQDANTASNPAIFARISKSGTPVITPLAGPPFNAGAGCAIEYLPGRLCMDGRARLGVLRGCADSGTTDATANQFAIYDIAAATWSVTSLPFPVDDGSEMCLVDDTLNIIAANGETQPLRFKVLPEPGVLLASPTNRFGISGGQTCPIAWRTGRIPAGAAATNLLYYTTNDLAGTWLLAGAGPADVFTNYVWQAPLNVTASQCYFRVVQTMDGWTDSLLMESFTNTSPTNFMVQFSATLPPSVVGATNQSGQITGSPSGTIAGTNAGTLVAMWWTNLATGAAGTGAGGTPWSISDITLELGSNMVVVAGSNAAGVVAMATQLFLRAGAAFVFPAGQVALRMQQDTTTNVCWRNGYMGATVASNYLAWSSNGLNGNWMALTSGTANATVTNFLFTAPVTMENSNCYFRVVHFCAGWGGWYTNDSAAFTLVPEPMLLTISFMGVLLVRAARRQF
ncbi:MAG: hypothetical protein NTV22_17955 [bacterium]|nr:hypothetical protein [bacterium]